MPKYFNLTGKFMNLQIERYKTIPVFIGVKNYPTSIAEQFPAIFKLVDKIVEKENINDVVEEVEKTIDEEIQEDVVEEVEIDNNIVEEVKNLNYKDVSYSDLKNIIIKKDIKIEGRLSKAKMISALEN